MLVDAQYVDLLNTVCGGYDKVICDGVTGAEGSDLGTAFSRCAIYSRFIPTTQSAMLWSNFLVKSFIISLMHMQCVLPARTHLFVFESEISMYSMVTWFIYERWTCRELEWVFFVLHSKSWSHPPCCVDVCLHIILNKYCLWSLTIRRLVQCFGYWNCLYTIKPCCCFLWDCHVWLYLMAYYQEVIYLSIGHLWQALTSLLDVTGIALCNIEEAFKSGNPDTRMWYRDKCKENTFLSDIHLGCCRSCI